MSLASLSHAVTDFIGDYGLYAVFLLMLIDAVFPAFSELVMVYAGALAVGAFQGQHIDFFGTRIDDHTGGYVVMVAAGTLGYTAGALLGWGIGVWGGRAFLERYGRYFHLGPEKLARADAWFAERGDAALFIGRILPVVRSFVSLPAGALRMPLWRYTWLTFAGSTLWCLAFAAIGLAVGESYKRFNHEFRYVEIAVVVVIVAVAGWALLRWRRRRAVD